MRSPLSPEVYNVGFLVRIRRDVDAIVIVYQMKFLYRRYPLFYILVNSLWLPKIIFYYFHNLDCLPNAKSDKVRFPVIYRIQSYLFLLFF